MRDGTLVDALCASARPLDGSDDELDPLAELASTARFVLIGEASHGTHEFYRDRARITRTLIARHGFDAVVIEGDWPDALRVDAYVRDRGSDASAREALGDFERFPTWMWRNQDTLEFVDWLHGYNAHHDARVSFYGLDLYSLHRSMNRVVAYLERVDPEAADDAKRRYACFDHATRDPQLYGLGVSRRVKSCEDEVLSELIDVRRRRMLSVDVEAADEAFFAEQNALVVRNAEQYYRQMFDGHTNTWNLRDAHMAESLDAIAGHLSRRLARPAKIVVWAHNSHVGDARATEFAERGELSLGQLARVRWEEDVFLIGQTTHSGAVTCATEWGGRAQRKHVIHGRGSAWEGLLHEVPHRRFWVDCHHPSAQLALREERLQRFIGVIYRPETELSSHYANVRLGLQLDAVLHSDVTRAVEPLERVGHVEVGELPDTFPSAL